MLTRRPQPALRPFVRVLWAAESPANPIPRERVLPTGAAHLAVRLAGPSLRLYHDEVDRSGRDAGHAVLGGPRATFYLRDVSSASSSVGAAFTPGAVTAITGVCARELAERHTSLEDIWGRAARELRERLQQAADPGARLDVLEAFLIARLPAVRGVHPAIAHALDRVATATDVRQLVVESGFSHRRFIELFRSAVGLPPKLYARVLRLQRALELASAPGRGSLADLALDAGYADQPHLNRDFRELAGISPGSYQKLLVVYSHHVPVKSIQDPRGVRG